MSTETENNKRSASRPLISVVVLVACAVFGMGAYSGLSALYEPPAAKHGEEVPMEVKAQTLHPQSYTMTLRGWGEAKSIDMVPISSKVPGEVVSVHPKLKMGNVIQEGEVLVKIEDADLRLLQGQAKAKIKQAEATIARMKAQYELDSKRLNTAKRSVDLARIEFEKDKKLLEERNVGSQSMVNASEINYNKALDAYSSVNNALQLFPTMLEEAESMLEAAKLQLEKVELDLARTEIKAPYTGRIKLVQVETGQTVGPGIPLVIFANDEALEVSVPFDSFEARKWLRFKETSAESGTWFGDIEPAECTISWTEDPENSVWKGTLNRIERYDQMTRTVTVSVRVSPTDPAMKSDSLPLVDGMFCEVEIQGKTLDNVYILPRWAVSFDNEVYLADKGDTADEFRLKPAEVEVLGQQGDVTVIANTLPEGTRVVTTKLNNPLRNSLLKIAASEGTDSGDPQG